jgi:hypothetical protein
MSEQPKPIHWYLFTRTTLDPKLSWIERQLDRLNIPHRRNGYGKFAPILEIPLDTIKKGWPDILSRRYVDQYGNRQELNDIDDDDPMFTKDIEQKP